MTFFLHFIEKNKNCNTTKDIECSKHGSWWMCLSHPSPSSGSMNQFIAVYNANGDVISNIKYYDGFMGQRIGAISCLTFHPYWVKIVSTDQTSQVIFRYFE